ARRARLLSRCRDKCSEAPETVPASWPVVRRRAPRSHPLGVIGPSPSLRAFGNRLSVANALQHAVIDPPWPLRGVPGPTEGHPTAGPGNLPTGGSSGPSTRSSAVEHRLTQNLLADLAG